MWDIDEDLGKDERVEKAETFKRKIELLKEKIDRIEELELGIDISRTDQSKDLVLYSSFKCEEDLDHYQKHEEHLKAVAYGKSFLRNRIVVDYEV